MTHLLIIARDAAAPAALADALRSGRLRAVCREAAEEAATALRREAFDLALVHAAAGAAPLQRVLRELRGYAPDLPLVVLAAEYRAGDEEAAFAEGADLYLSEPLPGRSLERILARYGTSPEPVEPPPSPAGVPAPGAPSAPHSALHVLRGFSDIFGFSLDHRAFTRHFILKLRDYVSFSRIAIFLEPDASRSFAQGKPASRLECVAALGLPSDLVDCFQLSREVGIGRALTENPRILQPGRRTRPGFGAVDATVAKEFGILGGELAVPVSDRERTIGIAVLSGPVTGREYSEDELQLLYLLMEELGQAVRNSRLHHDLAAHGELIENVLAAMSSGALVLGEDFEVRYANAAARKFLGVDRADGRAVDWAELPPALAGPLHRAVEKGELPDPFLIPGPLGDDVYRVSIIPFAGNGRRRAAPLPVIAIIEDFTSIEAGKQTALEETKDKLIALMAERFAHEIRNSLVPLTTHLQLLDKKIGQKKFQDSLKKALTTETGRIKRFSEQMLYIAQNSQPVETEVDLEKAVLEGFERARAHGGGGGKAELDLRNRAEGAVLQGNPEGVVYAFEELFLNSLQACAGEQTIRVSIGRNSEGILNIRLRDGGPGFDAAILDEALEPFFTTRNTGVGLGLPVARKIFQEHAGFLRLNARTERADWDIEIEVPAQVALQDA
jgi:signal transduction histidine kinase